MVTGQRSSVRGCGCYSAAGRDRQIVSATVVIPVHNGKSTLGPCLDGLAQQTVRGLEVIVVDDGSTDASGLVARQHGAQVIEQPCRGAAAARNRGVTAARGEIVLFTDSDCRPEPDWAERMLAVFEDESIAGCKGAYISHQGSIIARFVQLEYEDRYARTRRFDSIDFVDTYSAAYRRSVLDEIGGFDERFAGASVEDQELSFRVDAAGNRLVFMPEARVEHQHVETLSAYWRKKFRIGYDKPMVHRRHTRHLLRDSHTPPVLRLQTLLGTVVIAVAPLTTVSRQARRVALIAVTATILSGLPLTVRNMRKDGVAASVTPGMVLFRAVALASGLCAGTFQILVDALLPRDPSEKQDAAARLTSAAPTERELA